MPAGEGGGTSALLELPPTLDPLPAAVCAALSQACEAILVIGTQPREIVACNGAAERMFGYGASELLGRDTSLLHVDRGSFVEFGRRSEPALERDGVFCTPYRMRRKDGSVFDTLHTVSLLKRGEGLSGGAVSLVREVSKVAQLTKALEGSQEQLQQAQRRNLAAQLAPILVHDFNNALLVIQGNAELLMRSGLEGTQRELAEAVLQAVELAGSISGRLNNLWRREELQPRQLDLNAEIRASQALLRGIFPATVAVELRLAEGPARIRMEPAQVQQLLVNLALNARDAMPKGGRFRVETERVALGEDDPARPAPLAAGRYVRARLEDTGRGIPDEQLARVFEDFFTTKGERGTGLGLAAVRSIMEEGGGLVSLESQVGSGTTVVLWFPAAGGADEA